MHYAAELTRWEGLEIVQLHDHANHRCARVARHGAALIGFEVPRAGVAHDLAAGYRDAAEVLSRPASRFAIMVPFAGRIADARYDFDGKVQDLQPGVVGPQRASRHGFVRGVDFEVAALDADEHAARVTLTSAAIRPQPGYPHAIDLAVTYSLAGDGLTLEATMRNVGAQPAPCFFGWHPYFRVADGLLDDWEMAIPARTLIRTDQHLMPLSGAAAFAPLDEVPALDFRQSRRIGGQVIDQGYTDLVADPDRRIRSRLRDPSSGFGIAVWQERGVMHAFTADTISRDRRGALALEPMECMADAFNRPECADAVRLLPGTERRFRCGVEIDPLPTSA